jgi:hypothetical protein
VTAEEREGEPAGGAAEDREGDAGLGERAGQADPPEEGSAGGDSASRSEHLGGTGNPPEASRSLGDPTEHPEQHAALQSRGQAKSEPDEGTDNEMLDSEEHSEASGSFGTAEEES